MRARQEGVVITEEVKDNFTVKTREVTRGTLDRDSRTTELDYSVMIERR